MIGRLDAYNEVVKKMSEKRTCSELFDEEKKLRK